MAQKIIITDLHNDVLVERPQKLSAVLRNARAILAVWTTELKDPIPLFKKAQAFRATGNSAWAIEDLGFLSQTGVQALKEFTPVYASLTWNNQNDLAGGAHSDAGLKDFGKSVIKALEQQKIILDTAHLNQKSFFGVVEVAQNPFICSHTCFYGVNPHRRNLNDEQIKAVIKSGGVIGLTFVSEFLTGNNNAKIKDLIRHIEYFGGKFGLDNLAIGSDFYGTKHPAIKNYGQFKGLKKELLKLNYSYKQIDSIFNQNAARLLSQSY